MKVSRFFVLAGSCLLATLLFCQLPGCSGSSSGSATTGTLRVGITDKQSDDFQEVVIAIKEVRLVPAGMESARDDDPGLPLLVSYSTPHIVDVLKLRFTQELLGTVVIPAGTYNQVRLILEANPNGQGATPNNYLTLKSAQAVKIPLKTPSGQQSGLKVLGRFEVKPGVINAILLDFDPNTAIVARGNGDYNLKPTGIRIVQTADYLASFNALTGTVAATFKDWSSATLSVVPQGSSSPIAAGRLFSSYSSGRWEAPFSAFVPDGTYRVHVQANSFNNYSSQPTTVTGGGETSLGDILLVPAVP